MVEVKDVAFADMKVGDSASLTKKITDEDVRAFAEISGDYNPVHIDEEFANATMFKGRIAHGILVSGLISAVIGTQLPGKNTIYMGQNLKFTKPVYLNDEITAKVEVTNLREDKHIVSLKTTATNQKGEEVIVGDAVVLKK
ncbi:MAG: MaoC family dehydratase [Tissierellia bacterium]|nr:MaoC family dehydratase [Tissierellia bacterium]